MKRYIVFSGDIYDKRGGWNDNPEPFDNKEEAISRARAIVGNMCDWSHVADMEKREIIFIIKSYPGDIERKKDVYSNGEWVIE